MEVDPPAKRRKIDASSNEAATIEHAPNLHKGRDRPISPPFSRRGHDVAITPVKPTWGFDDVPHQTSAPLSSIDAREESEPERYADGDWETRFIPSPMQLTRIKKLASCQNIDAVGLRDLLGDPLIKECWNFNFLFDLDFVMQHFDSDVRDMVKVKIVHGFWKRDDENRIALLETAERYPNIELLSAYIPDPFGTHHSKMLILFRHDDTVQVVIHTANMIYRDWSNTTQAIWASPQLPLLHQTPSLSRPDSAAHPIGSGERFKVDLLQYLNAYERRTPGLTKQLNDYDFSSIRAAFIGSAPSRRKPAAASPSRVTSFGWLGLREILSSVPISKPKDDAPSHIVTQISSIATLGATPTWLSHFQSILACYSTKPTVALTEAPNFFAKRENNTTKKAPPPKHSIIFPTPEEIRTSLDGYASGHSVHWKLQSPQQQKQLEYMRPLLCHWKHPSTSIETSNEPRRKAGRENAAPHIKTYVRFSTEEHNTMDWVMMTSANFSKQAWGDVVNKKDEIWIQSWETGVVIWPALFARPTQAVEDVVMVPVFGRDMPGPGDVQGPEDICMGAAEATGPKTVIGFRMPYDLPLSPYAADEKPWCATMKYQEPDRYGHSWGGYGN
ncbi:tyrosyl-DNA phosphodiesterase 1 [Clathrospora elynae]|uniref:Tyrosyl-DNA phosphodiesterase 1 n=1 Tax=Clathrospora elynae TaxID=706981 RepID=A0A6A5SZA2_9PLEO|nr:tyrosyl-DNA phosphodiesterase 1 [Clathrospora elynae]